MIWQLASHLWLPTRWLPCGRFMPCFMLQHKFGLRPCSAPALSRPSPPWAIGISGTSAHYSSTVRWYLPVACLCAIHRGAGSQIGKMFYCQTTKLDGAAPQSESRVPENMAGHVLVQSRGAGARPLTPRSSFTRDPEFQRGWLHATVVRGPSISAPPRHWPP